MRLDFKTKFKIMSAEFFENESLNLPFANLPMVLREGVSVFKTEHEQKVFLYSSLGVLSGLCTRVTGEYRQQTCFPNLYSMIVAPAASGKSVLKYARSLVFDVHKEIIASSKKKRELFEEQLEAAKEAAEPLPKPPALQVALIPANCSSAKLYAHMEANGQFVPCIIAESELDTLTVANSTEYGNFSDLLRKSYHNEMVSYSRKKDNEFIELYDPKLAVILSGTPEQVKRFITNAEDGLLSRFMVFSFSTPPEWSSVAPCRHCVNLDAHFSNLSSVIAEYHSFLQQNPFSVKLSESQWEELDMFGEDHLYDALSKFSEHSVSLVKRHALMVYKICMLLTALRAAENNVVQPVITCSDIDFEFSLSIVRESLDNSFKLFASYPQGKVKARLSKKDYLEILPQEFTRSEGVTFGYEYGISERTTDRWLGDFAKGGQLEHKHGNYRKL
jgi:hypothetical protein